MKKFWKNSARSLYTVLFVFSLVNFVQMPFTDGSDVWQKFFTGMFYLFFGLVIFGAAAPDK